MCVSSKLREGSVYFCFLVNVLDDVIGAIDYSLIWRRIRVKWFRVGS